jgi:hypothetical protein
LSASNRNVQRAAPSGGSLQANMVNLASTSPLNFGGAPGQPLSYSAACNPPERKRRRTLITVFLQHKTASATSWSVRFWPWLRSLRSRIRARVWVRAGAVAGANQFFQLGAFFTRQFDMCMFTHVA